MLLENKKAKKHLINTNNLFNTNVKNLKINKEKNIQSNLNNLLSYIYLRVNYDCNLKFSEFKKYSQFVSNDTSQGILGMCPGQDYSKEPMKADDYFRKRVIKKKAN